MFRVFDIEENKFITAPFFFGGLGEILIDTGKELADPADYDRFIIEHFFGWHDKNQNKVFPGDIIKVCDYYMEPTFHAVEWGGKDYPAYSLNPDIGNESNCFSHIAANGDIFIEVIGNIHENPELIPTNKR